MKYLAAFASLFTFATIAYAAPIDVPSDAWYSTTVSEFGRAGYFDETQPFRPTNKATRAEFVQLVVKLQGGVKHAPFTTQSFDDVSRNNPFFNYFEEAGLAGWLKGTGSCYGTHPCTASPDSPINRAEASALMIRAFGLQTSEQAPSFNDNPSGQWFSDSIKGVASRCVLQGDAGGKRVRPADSMIRAEMVKMLERVLQNLSYPNCSSANEFALPKMTQEPIIEDRATPQSSDKAMLQCTKDDWECTTTECIGGSQRVSCKLVNSNCWGAKLPQTITQPCSSASSSSQPNANVSMKAYIELWKTWHLDLIAKAKELAHQQEGSRCLGILSDLESKFVLNFNEYVKYYNDPTQGAKTANYTDYENEYLKRKRKDRIAEIETFMAHWKYVDFDAAPSICFSSDSYNKTPTYTPSYPSYTPSLPTYSVPQKTHQQMCDEMTAQNAINGGFGSSGFAYQMLQAGCITMQQYCNGLAISGSPQSMWPAECR